MCILALVIMGAGVFYINTRGVSKVSDPVVFEVQEGTTLNRVIGELDAMGIIKSEFFAKIHVRLFGANKIEVGLFDLDKSWSVSKILSALEKANPKEDVSVQLTEGFWAKDMAKAISERVDVDMDSLLELWNDEVYVSSLIDRYEVLTPDILNQKNQVRVLLEGYLYPDTYRFFVDSTPKEITERILDNTERYYQTYKDELNRTTLSLHDIITLSSIVMYEANTLEDQKLVAGVFLNRLDIDMLLQSSVTVCYTLYEFDDWQECELFANQKIDSPYNTYVRSGLPAGPILNPNAEAILATLNATKSDYLFFVADVWGDGDGTVYYSKTYAEHQKKVKELQSKR